MKHLKKFFVTFLVICSVIACFQPLQASAATIKLSKKRLYLDLSETYKLSLKKGKKKISKAKWSSSNKKVATVSKTGKVKAVSVGNAVIKATYNKKVYKCNVYVRDMMAPDTGEDSDEDIDQPQEPEGNVTDIPGNAGVDTDNQVVSEVVKWNTVEAPFEGAYSLEGEKGTTQNIPLGLMRKYVTFDPWPTTVDQVVYVIENCDDPYVIAALEVVALDNYKYEGFGKYTCEAFAMWDALMSGAGLKSGYGFCLPTVNKQGIQSSGFSMKQGSVEPAYTFASRAYLYGATPENQYTPMVYGTNTPCLNDKTKWAIAIDQFMYCGDFYATGDMTSSYYRGLTRDAAGSVTGGKYITLCPHRYSLVQETDGGLKTVKEHFGGGIHIGLAWNTKYSRWVTVSDYATLNNGIGEGSGWEWTGGFNPYSAGMTSNNYVAPKVDDGF